MDPVTFAAICADIGAGMPAYKATKAHKVNDRVFWGYLATDEKAAEEYARAKAVGIERYADDLLKVSDNPRLLPENKRVMVDTRKWLLSKLVPRKYGDKIQTEHSGTVNVTTVDYTNAVKG